MYSWPLNDLHFTLLDRLKLALFFLNKKNRWSMGERVRQYEDEWLNITKNKYAVMTNSGSTANTLIARYLRTRTQKRKVIVPAVTWHTAVSPWIEAGFEPVFIDVDLQRFSIDLDLLENYLQKYAHEVACVAITSLLGFTPNVTSLQVLCRKYGVNLRLDNCENAQGSYDNKHICSDVTCSISTYIGHQLTTIEGGMIFTNSDNEYRYYLMGRNHGLVRALEIYNIDSSLYYNKLRRVDPKFDFYQLGSNFRNTEIGAYIGLLDLQRYESYRQHRINMWNRFKQGIQRELCLPATYKNLVDVPFSLPIILHSDKAVLEQRVNQLGIETRPIVGGNLLRQTCFMKYGNAADYPNAEFLHTHGFYVGLHYAVKSQDIDSLVKVINENN